ncbi:MAG TPA: hypothetical protein VGQ94_09230, partial [Terriglobales bacterium]|nr:hypothetical protein [Terriglobales bacterium]
RPVGENPPGGAILDYYFKSEPSEEVTLEISDAQGNLVRRYSSKEQKKTEQPPEWPDLSKPPETIPAKAGMNRFAWNLRYASPVETPGAFYAGNGPEGPLVLPGTYQVKMTEGGQSQTAPLEIKPDPRVKAADADLRRQFELAMKVRERITELHKAVNQIRDLRSQLQILKKRLAEQASAKPGVQQVLDAAAALDMKMTAVEQELIQIKMKSSEGNLRYPNMLNEQFDSFRYSVESADAAPPKQVFDVFDHLSGRLDAQLAAWKQITAQDVAALNDMIRKQEIPALEAASAP